MYLVKLLDKCKDIFLLHVGTEMKRGGADEAEIGETTQKLGEIIDEYNDVVLRAFGENIIVPLGEEDVGEA